MCRFTRFLSARLYYRHVRQLEKHPGHNVRRESGKNLRLPVRLALFRLLRLIAVKWGHYIFFYLTLERFSLL